ncbi:ABC transporter substrate-binding protein [Defluviitalea raffinosedens]|uniref:ABC transporter substrate-binding protein n=1 Tax=Defluviitalea raffinosedens TaxID=1450156 RepID=A0A7C8HF23_9FIRM|nr:ABC transporter substrate-binding protein [Defluviitalea raffinosedens]KAE9634946.1 ABC transporter substrate-binding protein [Defluviitalea raffinosedens]MBM7685736.1 peptide/nickel transport system substrate-binding protein [Defluviitalea raffinosedens]
MKAKKLFSFILSIAMVCSLTACGNSEKASTVQTEEMTVEKEENSAQDASATPRNETLYFAGQQWGTINDWNPMSSNSNNGMALNQAGSARVIVWETLFMYNMLDGKLYGLLGTDYSWNDDNTELTVHLNKDAKWNDGTEFTAEDVVATFDAHIKYESPTGSDFKPYIEKVEAKDDYTVVFYATKDASGKAINPLKVLDFIPKIYIMQKEYLETVAARNNNDANAIKQDKMEDLVSTGPYKPYYYDDQKVVLIRDDNYWGQAKSMWGKLPVPKYLAHTIFSGNDTALVALKAGEIDVAQMFVANVQNLWLQDKLPISTYIDEAPYGICAAMPTIWFNTRKDGLDKKEVRKAIAMAVDYDQINKAAMTGQSPTFDEVPRSVMNATDAEQSMIDKDALKDYQFGNDPNRANKLLDEAGIVDTDGDGIREYPAGNNLRFKAECPEGWSDWNATLEIVAAAGKKIGIDITTYFPDASTYMEDLTTANFDIIMATPNGTASITCPWQRCLELMGSDLNDLEVVTRGNFGRWKNDRADELLALIPNETDTNKLKEYYTELSKIYLEEVPSFTAMYRPAAFHIVNETVWTNFPQQDDGTNIPPYDCTDGYGVAALYNLTLVEK